MSSGMTTSWFFNAVPHKDILRSAHTLVREYQQHTGCSVLSIDLLSKTGHPGKPRGRTKSSLKRCWIHDILAFVELSFSTGVFTAAGKCRLQVEGTCIGNEISPILSGLPVFMAERQFLLSLPTTVSWSFLFLRYVDNRLLLGPTATLQSEQLKAFCDPHFYDGILLETVSDHQWLGFTIDAKARTATADILSPKHFGRKSSSTRAQTVVCNANLAFCVCGPLLPRGHRAFATT